MVELERSQVSRVTTDDTVTAQLQYQLEFPDSASLLLLAVALTVVVRMPVLAVS